MTPHVLFDIDGTLMDSAPGITRSLAHAMRAVGGPAPAPDALRPMIGTPLHEILEALLPDADAATVEAARAAYVERFNRVGMRESAVFPGVAEALQALAEAGSTLYVASAKSQAGAERVIDHFELRRFFRGVFGSVPDAGIVSKTAVLQRALEQSGIPGPSAALVGDRSHDVEAAHALGLRAIGVAWGYGPADELATAHAVAASPSALLPLLRDGR